MAGRDIIVLLLVLIVGVFSLLFLFSSVTGAYGSSKGHPYFYETGNSGITGPPDFIVTTGLGSVPYCFNSRFEEGGFRTDASPQFTWDYVSCFVVAPDDLFGKDRGSLPVHCFLRTPYSMPSELPHPATCSLKAKEMRYQDGFSGGRVRSGVPAAVQEAGVTPSYDVLPEPVAVTVQPSVDVVAGDGSLRVG